MPSILLKDVYLDLPDYNTVVADFTVNWREDERTGRVIVISFYLEAACVDSIELEGPALAAFRDESVDDMERYAWPHIHYRLLHELSA